MDFVGRSSVPKRIHLWIALGASFSETAFFESRFLLIEASVFLRWDRFFRFAGVAGSRDVYCFPNG